MSWPQDSEGTKRLAEQENSTMSMDVWLLAAALASLAVVAVSETEPTTTVMRRVVLGHALLSYMFGPGVLTVAMNLVMSLGQRHGWPLRVSDPAVKGE